MALRLPARFVVGSGPTYALVLGDRGWVFRAWSELEAWRERFGLEPAEVQVRKFSAVDEAEAWLRASGIGSFDRWVVEDSRAQRPPEEAAAAGPHHRLSFTPSEIARRVADDPALGLGIPGAREAGGGTGAGGGPARNIGPGIGMSSTLPTGREALRRALGGADLPEHAELRVPGGVKEYPSFGFTLTLPGNVIYAEAKNLILRPALHGVRSPRGKMAAVFLEALNSDLGKLAVAVRVNTMLLYNALKRHVANWRANGGRDAKKKPIEDFELLDALETLIRERGLTLRVSEDAVGRVESARGAAAGAAGAASAAGAARAGPGNAAGAAGAAR
jgi:hypothetical protein